MTTTPTLEELIEWLEQCESEILKVKCENCGAILKSMEYFVAHALGMHGGEGHPTFVK